MLDAAMVAAGMLMYHCCCDHEAKYNDAERLG